jgi:pimeloyl-ACP methyl ester carboxylesterase
MLRSLAGGSLFGERWGEAPARVLALHGWARTHADFAPSLGSGARGGPLDVVAPDLPGFGATPPPPSPWGSADYATALLPLFGVDGADGEAGPASPWASADLRAPAVVVGHSFGGRVALALAADHPELVAGLVLTGVPQLVRQGSRHRPPAAYRAVRALRRAHLVSERRLEEARQRYGSPDYRNAPGVMRGVLVRVLSEPYEPLLARLSCPVELLWAEDDTEAPLAVARAAAALVPGAVLTTCGRVGHLTPLSAPEALRAAVGRVLAAGIGSPGIG